MENLMDRKTVRKTGQFRARADDGRDVVIHEFTEFTEVVSSMGAQQVEGLKSLKLSDGTPVNVRGDGVYKVFPHGPTLHRA